MFMILFLTLSLSAQQKLTKTLKTVNANSDVTIDLNTSFTNIEIDTWDKNSIEVEAYIESSEMTNENLKQALEDWHLDIEGSGDEVEISSRGGFGGNYAYDFDFDYAIRDALEAIGDMDFDFPEMPDMDFEMPEMPEMNFEMPEMPELPELPELPEGIHNVNFDSKAYEKEGEAYLERWSKEYKEKYGKEFQDKMKAWAREFAKTDWDAYSAKMEKWGEKFGEEFGEKFGKDMEKWGEEFSKKFDDKWAKDMEEWGEKFGEKFGKEYEERMEKRGEEIERRMEEREAQLEARIAEREARYRNLKDAKVKRTLKIKMPKDAKLKVNVRHGELKFTSVIYNLNADLEHSRLAANSIDGSRTSINASYSPVVVQNWNDGELKLNFVEDASLKQVKSLILSSNSSNINIGHLTSNAIINGSFGDLLIKQISNSFTNLNIILENSDAFVTLPKTNYDLVFKGNRSRFNDEITSSKTIKNYPSGGSNGGKTIMINAKFSNVIMQ